MGAGRCHRGRWFRECPPPALRAPPLFRYTIRPGVIGILQFWITTDEYL